MACKKIARTNGSESKLVKTLEHIYHNEFKVEEAYAYFDVVPGEESAFVEEFGDWVEGYKEGDPSFQGRVYDNGEPKLFYNDETKKYYFIDKNGEQIPYPIEKRGLRSIFDYKQMDKIVSRLALNYFKKSNLNFNNIEFEEGEKLPKLEDNIKAELEAKIKQLQAEGGMKGKIMSKSLAKSLTYLDEYVDRVDNFYKQISIKRVDNDDVADLQSLSEEGKDPVFNRASFEQDSKNSLSNNIKLRLSLLENTEETDPVWNEPTFVPFNDVYSTLLNNISNQVALEGEDLFDLQRNAIKKIAYKKEYLNQLIGFFNDKRFAESDKNQFTQAFNLHKQNFLVSEIKTKSVDPETNNVSKTFKLDVKEVSESGSKASIVESEWGNNFRLKFLKEDNSFREGARAETEKIAKELSKLQELVDKEMSDVEFAKYANEFVALTRDLGIELTKNGFDNFLDDNGTKTFNIEHQKDKLSKAVKRTNLVVSKSFNYFKKAHKDFKNPFETQSVFKEFAKAEAFFLSEGSDASIWTSGKNKWLYSYPSYISTRILQWKKDPEMLKNWYEQSAYNRGSELARYLLGLDVNAKDEFGNKAVFKDGLKEERKRVSKERLEKLNLGVFNTFQEVNGDFVSASDISYNDYFNDHLNKVLHNSYVRTTTPADKTTDLQIRTGLFIDTTTVRGGEVVLNDRTLKLFFNYFNSEFNRMKEAGAEIDAARENPENLRIHYHYKAGSENIYSGNGNAFNSQYFPELSFSVKSDSAAANSIKKQLYTSNGAIAHTADLSTNSALRSEIESYINETLKTGVAETIYSFITQEVIEIDKEGAYKNKSIDKDVFQKYLENNFTDSNNAVASAASDFYINGIVQNIEYSKLFTGDVAFYKNMVDYKKRIPGTYTDGLQLRIKEGEESFTAATINSIEIPSPVLAKLVEMLGEEGAKPYEKINSADAQAWITPERWKFLLERLGKWDNKTHGAVYQKMISDTHPIYSKEELKIMAQPLKGVYFYMNGKTPTYLKYSQAVLTRGLTKGTGLEKLFNGMTEQGVDELITIDGFKVGSPTPTTVHNSKGQVLDNVQFNKVSLSNYGWKLQQDLPIKTFKQTDVGSQIQKNIFAGLKFNTKEKGFNLDGQDVTGQDVIDGISNTVKGLIGKGLEEINKEFGIGRNGKIHNVKGLYNALVRELEKRGGAKNIIDALNKQVVLYGMPQSIDKIISIYSSIMNDRLIKIKTNGGAFIQMSNFGISKEDGDQGIIWSPVLKPGDTTFEPTLSIDENTGKTIVKPGGILISGSFIAKYIDDYKKYKPEQLFGYIDKDGNKVEGIIDQKILENIIGYRIPNQGLSSNDALQIVGILPEENGDTIVAYTGITTKTGSDFDIDKMFIMMSNYTLEDGKLKYSEYDSTIPDNEQSKEALQNRLIELYKAVLTNPKVIKDVMKPVDIEFIKNEINALVEADTNKPMFHFDSTNDIKLRYEFIGGKAGVGQEANALVDINRLGHLSINNYYIGWGHSQAGNKTKESVFDKEFSESLSKEDLDYYLKAMNGGEALANEIKKVRIGDSLTAILNAFVDIAKDPYITRGNWTTSTTNTGNLLLRAGVHPLYVTAFMAQPIIKQYVQYQSSLESITSKNSGDTKTKFRKSLVLERLDSLQEEHNLPYGMIYQKMKVGGAVFGDKEIARGKTEIKKVLGKKATDDEIAPILNTIREAHNEIFKEKKINITDREYNLEFFRDQITGKSDGAFQLAVYNKFLELQEISKTMKENIDVSKLDTNGMGKNINSLYSIFNLKQHIQSKEEANTYKALNGIQSKFDNTVLGHYFESLKEMMRIVQANPSLFPQGQRKVQDMFNTISMDLYNMPAIDEALTTDLEKNYYTYVMANFNPFNLSSVEAKELLNNLPTRFNELKKANKGKYMMLDELQIKKDGKVNLIALNNRKKSTSFEEKFTDSWRDLILEHPDFANDLIKYSFFTSGFRMNANQFYTYIPNEFMIKEGINYFVPKFSRADQMDFIDKFYLNNTDKYRYIPLVFENEMLTGDKNSGFIKKESGKGRFYVQLNETHIYKLEGYDNENRALYTRVNPLGKKVKGSVIVEYGDPFIDRKNDASQDYINTIKERVVTQRDKFNPDFILGEIENRKEEPGKPVEIEELKPEVKEEVKKVEPISEYPIEIGRFVEYNGTPYIVTKFNAIGTVQIYNPGMEGALAKLAVSKAKITAKKQKANLVTYLGNDYMVTPNKTIISLGSNKIMNWAENDKNRLNILSLSENGVLAVPTVEVKTEPVNDSSISSQEFKPANAQQENAINVIQDFIRNGNPSEILIIEGKAGTGKTTIVQEAIAPFINKGILIAALSHKAKLVLSSKLNKRYPGKVDSGSIAGILGKTMNLETGEFTDSFAEDAKITKNDIIIIDEASMVNEEAIQMMMEMKRNSAKLIFLGDRGQLPPIRDLKNPYYDGWSKADLDSISPVFDSGNKASLTERVRQGEESPILPFADYYWDNSELEVSQSDPIPEGAIKDILSPKGNLVFVRSFGHIFEDVVDSFKRGILEKNPNVIKVVTYRNATRNAYNTDIRKAVFGDDVAQFVNNDIIMFQDNFDVDSRTKVSNSDEFSIERVFKTELNGFKAYNITVQREEGFSGLMTFPVLADESKADFDAAVADLFAKAKQMPAGPIRKMGYAQAWKLKKSFANIDYAYAITSHKSQGSTYDSVVVDIQDINSVGPLSAKSKSRSIYTALTRAKNTVIGISNKATTVEGNASRALNLEHEETYDKPMRDYDMETKLAWEKHSTALTKADPTLTFEAFKALPQEEKDKLIECYGK